MLSIKVITAQYLQAYKISIVFSDDTKRVIDFEPFLFAYSRGYYDKYRKLNLFRDFKIEEGNIVWGKDWDLIFSIKELYRGKIKFSEKPVTQEEFNQYLSKSKQETRKSPYESAPFNEYHKMRSAAAAKAIQEMLKNPLTKEESMEQVKRLNNQSYLNRGVKDESETSLVA